MEATAKSSSNPASTRQLITKEIAIFVGLLFFGVVLLPVLIYWVGQVVFGDYGGLGYSEFFGALMERVRNGDWASWLLILAPYTGWQCLRLTVMAWRLAGR